MERKNSYMYGSVAPKLPERAVQPEEQQRAAKGQPKLVRSQVRTSSMPKARMVFALLFVTAVCFVILYRFSVIAELNAKMGKLTEQYNALKNENRMLRVEIETSIDLDYVRQVAETKLNMHKPDNYQIVLVSVPKSSYNVVLNHDYIDETTQQTSLADRIKQTVKSVLP
ncbi:MAG TPA: hypothetical protein GX501_00110 [Clostridiaceae bacterium]|nr:hypothetical protein [Clostridiaceae bacterium]